MEREGGQMGRVGTEVTDLNKWKELRLAVGHFSQNGLSVQSTDIPLLNLKNCHKLKAETQNNFFYEVSSIVYLSKTTLTKLQQKK